MMALDTRIADLAEMDRADMQKTALMNAAGNVDTSDLTTQANVNAANAAIAALKAALAAATDVSDADKAMYQTTVDSAEAAVMMAQSTLDHASQTMALTDALTALQAIDLTGLTTQAAIDAAEEAIGALRMALDAATELSDAEKAAAMTELAAASRTVMAAQGRVDTASQQMMLDDAYAALQAIDLNNLMTQDDIDAAERAIAALDLALEAATSLTAAQKLDARTDVTLAKRRVMAAQTALDNNVQGQRDALMTAGMALDAIDLEDLDTQDKIDAAEAAVEALEMALDAATHLSEADKAMYQSQADTADEAVKMAQTGMNENERMTAQRSAIMNAVTMARTAVAGVNDDSTDTEVASADAAIAALKMAIEDAEDLPEGDSDVSMAMGTLATLEGQLAAAKTSRMAAMEKSDEEEGKAMAALGKAMRAALGGAAADGTDTALANIAQPTLAPTGLTINAVANAGSLTEDPDGTAGVELKAVDDSDTSLGGWMGMDYALSTGVGMAKVTNEARVYTNKGPGTRVGFAAAGYTVATANAGGASPAIVSPATTAIKGYISVDGSSADEAARVMAPAFMHGGTQSHTIGGTANSFTTQGTYDGAPGEYRCVTGCTSTNDGKGSPSALGGTWFFKPNPGAMVIRPDTTYLYYGWWVSKDDEDMPTAASAFTGTVLPTGGTAPVSVDLSAATIAGSATYSGHAAGKFAMSNPLDGTGSGGHFTADATLTAKLGVITAPNNGGVSGMLDNFMANDESVPWSVELHLAPWGTTGAFATPAADVDATEADERLGTTWSINDNAAPRSGTWSGQMYDELPGDANADPAGDGSNLPTTVTGTFYSEFSTIGRMVGAFGADKQ